MNHSPDEKGPEGLDSDELALRRMLHQAVQEIEPRDGTLDHLRRAVPARRARKRQAAVGMAAAALFVGTAVPALVHVSNSSGLSADPSIAANHSQAQGGGQGEAPDGEESSSGGNANTGTGDGGQKDTDKGESAGTGTGAPTDPTATRPADAPACTSAQLGSATATAAVPDSAGIVYGAFRITNVSAESCVVGALGTITPLPQGAADATKISVAEHTSGDEAADLPDPSLYVPELTIAPGSAYEVRFAWVPSETCPSTGTPGGTTGEPSPSPSATDSSTTTSGGSTGGDTGTSTQLVTENGTADGSVVVSYTAEQGSPTVSVQVDDACAGTVYRTGVLTAS